MTRTSPARTSTLNRKLTADSSNASYGRDLFGTSTPQTTRTTKFAPNLPAAATNTTPTARKFTHKNTNGGGMSAVSTTEHFKLKIPSPGPELSGEALAKQVPDDPNRASTIYADQFLAHKCPPNFDDEQRRQFFCILDLRRLKYAANEIFVKKDWKLNIMNFSREYEKSRGLIMLRYGLYQFKNVKPSEEVLKKWRATHNLPDPGQEAGNAPIQNKPRASTSNTTSTKRKAEDDLAPKDNTLMASNANQNKRRNVTQEAANPALTGPAPFKKSKRKADETDEPDENLPTKVQKPTPSAAKSKFDSILNNSTQSGNASPPKRPALAPFASQKFGDSQGSSLVNKPNPFAANGLKPLPAEAARESNSTGSVLATHKIGSAPATKNGNIFGYLSESSANSSGNDENGNAEDGDTESESEEETAGQEAPATDKASGTDSVGTTTPPTQNASDLFAVGKPSTTSNIFGGTDKSSGLAAKGGLFERVKMGSNGQPVRATNGEDQGVLAPTKQPSPGKEPAMTPARKPGDYTFNASTTPINFGKSTSGASGVSQTPATTSNAESFKENSEPADAPTTKTASLFGADAAFQPIPQCVFGASSKSPPKTYVNPHSTSTPAPSNMFGTAKLMFGGAVKASEPDASADKVQQKSAPNSSNPTSKAETPSASKEPTSIFGASTTKATATPQTTSLFSSTPTTTESQTNGNTNGNTKGQLSFVNNGKPFTSTLFGASPTPSVLDTPKQQSAGFSFGGSKTDDAAKASNGVSQDKSTSGAATPKLVFGSEVSKPASTATPSLFGGSSSNSTGPFNSNNGESTPAEKKSSAAAASSLFGDKSTTPSATLFGSTTGNAAPAKKDEPATTKPASLFGNSTPSTAPIFGLGGQTTTPATNNAQSMSTSSSIFGGQPNGAEPKKLDFQFGGGGTTTPSASFSFGSETSDGSGFTFMAGGAGQSFNNPFASPGAASSAPMFGGQPPASAPSMGFNFGQQAPSTPNPAPNGIFGASTNGGNGAPNFNFTQATPTPSSPNPFAPIPTTVSFGGTTNLMPAGGETSTGAGEFAHSMFPKTRKILTPAKLRRSRSPLV